MANISIRKLEDNVVNRLRVRAAGHGVSMEEEVRQIIRRAVAAPERLGDFAVLVFSPGYGNEEFVLPEREHAGPIEFL